MPILEVQGLVKFYGRRKVVDGVNFEVNPGEIVGLLGPNGAGKTTSFRMTTGQVDPNDGKVWFNGHDVTALPMYKRARLGMGYLSQETSVFRKLTVEQNILAILEAKPASRSLGRKLTRRERWDRTKDVLERFGLTRVTKNNAARLSGGEKRRLEIARCLVCEPLLILLDEPFTGIDPKTIADIQQIVLDLRRTGIAILVTDHNVRETLKITDRSYLIKDGKVRTHGTPHQIVQDPIAINEYLGASFSDDRLSLHMPPSPATMPAAYSAPLPIPTPSPATAAPAHSATPSPEPIKINRGEDPAVQRLLEQEKIHWLIDNLKSAEREEAVAELRQLGNAALPFLIEALERRDVDLRQHAFEVVQVIVRGTAQFDAFAPESERKQQIDQLRDKYAPRRAG